MRVVLCALAKNENLYINQWVEHYVKLGFDTIYLYDNNDLDTPFVLDFIDKKYLPYIKYNDIRGIKKEKLQHDIYTQFYNEYKYKFDWVLYCDLDEYLVGISNVKTWLLSPVYKSIGQIRIKWRLFGDDDMVERDTSVPLLKAFTKEVKSSLNRNLVDKGNLEKQGKAFVKGGMNNIVVQSPHFASIGNRKNIVPSILPSGRVCRSLVVINEDYSHECIYINHYMTKTISEFLAQKLNRSDAVFGNTPLKLDYFWRINKKTKEKLDYINRYFNENN